MAGVGAAAEEDEAALLGVRPLSVLEVLRPASGHAAVEGQEVTVADATIQVFSAARQSKDHFLNHVMANGTIPDESKAGIFLDGRETPEPPPTGDVHATVDVHSDPPAPPHVSEARVPLRSGGMEVPAEEVSALGVADLERSGLDGGGVEEEGDGYIEETPLMGADESNRPGSEYINLTTAGSRLSTVSSARGSIVEPFFPDSAGSLSRVVEFRLSEDAGGIELRGTERVNPLYRSSVVDDPALDFLSTEPDLGGDAECGGDGLGADSEDRETQLSQLELESSDGGRLMMLRKNKGSGYSLGSGKSVVLEEAPGGGVRIALEENTYHTTWGDMDYDRGDADHDMDAAIVQWEVERDDETMRMLLDRWTYLESQLPPGSVHPERAEFMAKHGGLPDLAPSNPDPSESKGDGGGHRGTGDSTMADRRMSKSRSDSVRNNRMSRASMLLDTRFDGEGGDGGGDGAVEAVPIRQKRESAAGVSGALANARHSTASVESRLSLLCDGRKSSESWAHLNPESNPGVQSMLDELASVRRASAAVDDQLDRLAALSSSTSLGPDSSAVGSPSVPGAPPSTPATSTTIGSDGPDFGPAESPIENDELAQLRAELAAVRAQSAKMEAAIAEQEAAGASPSPPPPPPESGLTNRSSRRRSPARPAPPPPAESPSAPPATGEVEGVDYGVLPLANLSARAPTQPRGILRPPPPPDPAATFPPTVWLDCYLEAHAVMAANEVWGFEYADSSDDSDDLLGLAMAAGAVC